MTTGSNKILLSGVKPTGRPHIGNYFGAMRQFVDLQNSGQYRCFFMIADLHSLTTIHDARQLRSNIAELVIDYLAIGLDPNKSVIFKQSDISSHAELAWIFDCITTIPYLMRAHAYKDASAKNKEISVGTFNYPMLMAADILLYETDVVPVGQDQKQHVEYARDTAEKFNHIFGQTFKLPQPLILADTAVIPGTDGRKMSKSYGNTIELFSTKEEIIKSVMKIPTDSKGISDPKDPNTDTLFALHKLFNSAQDLKALENQYREGKIGYKQSKEMLIEKIDGFLNPLRQKRQSLEKDKTVIHQILREGAEKARRQAEIKQKQVRTAIGIGL